MYAGNSSLLLVFYSYKKYSDFSLKVLISTCQCEVKAVSICQLEHDSLNLESQDFSIWKQGCMVLQLDYGQANFSIFDSKASKHLIFQMY